MLETASAANSAPPPPYQRSLPRDSSVPVRTAKMNSVKRPLLALLALATLFVPGALAQGFGGSTSLDDLTEDERFRRRITPEVEVVRLATPAVVFIQTNTKQLVRNFWGQVYPRNGQSSGKPSHKGVYKIDEAPGDGPLGHDGTGHYKKGNGQEDKFIQSVKELLGQDLKGGIGKQIKGDRGGNPEDDRDGHAGQEQQSETEADGQGHGDVLNSLRKLTPTVKNRKPMTMEKIGMGR